MKKVRLLLLPIVLFSCALAQARNVAQPAAPLQNSSKAIILRVDATEAPRRILHAQMTMPVSAGPLVLFYPKWIPGEHGPTGPITNLVGLKFAVNGRPLPWVRDLADMYTFHCDIPQGANTLEVNLDFLLSSDPNGFSSAASSSARLTVISWNQVLLYPQGTSPDELSYATTLRLPAGWKFGTALPVDKESRDSVSFKPVSLYTLIDSPTIAGAYFRVIPLVTGNQGSTEIDMVADSPAALEMPPEMIAHYKQLVAEVMALFGARHYLNYHFLFTLSDHVANFGLEHHQSSDDRVGERTLLDEALRKVNADLLPHEFVHSWNGKYRRPADLTTPDYQQPMKTDLLWVYEGLTQYLGKLLAERSGLWTAEDYRDKLALIAAQLDYQPGRMWRPLVDTATTAQLLYSAPSEWGSYRRGVDFYDEGVLIWLEADSIIRQQTKGARSLDDFCRRFYGGQTSAPEVKTYTLEDVVAAMNEIAPYDWRTFFETRIYKINARAPLGGITGDGWKLVYTEEPNNYMQAEEQANKGNADFSFSIGLRLREDGTIIDVILGMSAAEAGLAPGMKLMAVNGRKVTPEILREALRAAKLVTTPIELMVDNDDYFSAYRLNYHNGLRYPHLVRDAAKPDMLNQVLSPLAPRLGPGR